ncbi:hypothetical protein [Pedobacter sp. V48]|uniref:hypothetical protein n=1 Tax=Pedobacter sp. V48 TaxID=509635 RepID=UPI0003E48B16|nr:hypothetical protein [Pedobacter sp. V48]ETZ23058.1 hypothetical protein N824_20695 [Pedobacter sp. V48]
MRFSIKDPTDNKPLLLNAIPALHQGEQALKVIFPEKDSITMIKRNNVWTSAGETDLRAELVKAISRGIQLHIEQHSIQQKQNSFKITAMKNLFPILVFMAGLALTSCGSSDRNKAADSLMTDSSRIDTSSNPDGGMPDTSKLTPDSLQVDTL